MAENWNANMSLMKGEIDMNLLESYIKEIHSVTDVTEDFMKHCGYEPKETLFEVKKDGYYMS